MKHVDWLDSWVRTASGSKQNLTSLPFLIAYTGKTLLKLPEEALQKSSLYSTEKTAGQDLPFSRLESLELPQL